MKQWTASVTTVTDFVAGSESTFFKLGGMTVEGAGNFHQFVCGKKCRLLMRRGGGGLHVIK